MRSQLCLQLLLAALSLASISVSESYAEVTFEFTGKMESWRTEIPSPVFDCLTNGTPLTFAFTYDDSIPGTSGAGFGSIQDAVTNLELDVGDSCYTLNYDVAVSGCMAASLRMPAS